MVDKINNYSIVFIFKKLLSIHLALPALQQSLAELSANDQCSAYTPVV